MFWHQEHFTIQQVISKAFCKLVPPVQPWRFFWCLNDQMKSHFSVFCLNLISLNGSSVFFSLLESIICLLRSITMPKRDLYVDQLKRMWRGSNNLWEFGHRLEQPQLPLRIVAACAWTRHFSNQGSVLDYFTCCLFQETNTAFQIQILVFSMVSSYVQHLWVWAKGLCNGQVIVTSSTLFPYVFFFFIIPSPAVYSYF